MTSLGYVFVFTDRREEVARFYSGVLGLPVESDVESEKDDAVWFRTEGARLAVHDSNDRETAREVRGSSGFVTFVSVDDFEATFERARAAGAVVGQRFRNWFFVRDPEGRFIGVRGER